MPKYDFLPSASCARSLSFSVGHVPVELESPTRVPCYHAALILLTVHGIYTGVTFTAAPFASLIRISSFCHDGLCHATYVRWVSSAAAPQVIFCRCRPCESRLRRTTQRLLTVAGSRFTGREAAGGLLYFLLFNCRYCYYPCLKRNCYSRLSIRRGSLVSLRGELCCY